LFRRLDHKGKTAGEIEALLILLDARGIDVPEDVRSEITSCTSLRQLGRWIRLAATADRIEDLGFSPTEASTKG
jgi:hypothetical protein